MSSLLIKEPSKQLHDWLRDEAKCNGRSINSQVIVCLEWCMRTYGEARLRPPFGEPAPMAQPKPQPSLRGALAHLRPAENGITEKNAWRKAAVAKHANTH